ncbi:DUF2735 domain-containing protein [Rhizobium sp. XQZ8]|uniref:DUF2735 domain-containing protein n=1 Tax=Rhizobium populisoli TaxID=2859785 RepID=UPI001C68466E|nr:DUF2735 domain-containing protein [Rhizobium populisoli]MBW6423222.1 DUF2735 domain-containing protein [Rhizobium populisoli]
MATVNIHRETAQILAFPARPRRKLDNGLTAPAGIYEMSPDVVDVSCWYHDEAVQDGSKTDRPKPC